MARPASLTPEQRRVVAQLKAAPSWNRASPKVRKALLEAAAVESNFSTPDQAHSDRDSEGALQQRPSSGWGPTSESNTTDAEQFLRRAIPLARKYGSAGALAQAVQRSAFPDRYNQRSGIANFLLGSSPRSSGGATASAASAGSTRTTTTTTPGVDNSQQRAMVALNFLGNKNADVLDFASQIKQLQDIPGTTETKTTRIPGSGSPDAPSSNTGPNPKFGRSHSPLLELIHKGGPGYAVKNGKKVNGAQFYASVWNGHADHVHVAAGPKTIVQLGKLAQQMGLHVGENPHFGGVAPVHSPHSYHYRNEAIDVSGDPRKMNAYAARVERLYGLK